MGFVSVSVSVSVSVYGHGYGHGHGYWMGTSILPCGKCGEAALCWSVSVSMSV